MQNIYISEVDLHNRPEVIEKIDQLGAKTIIDIGGSWNCWLGDRVTHMFDFIDPNTDYGMTVNNKNIKWFSGNINDLEDWVQIFDYVEEHGKFDFCNCTHTLEDIAYPIVALKYMPKIAKAGFVSVPSKYWELQRGNFLHRGGHHHRWLFDNDKNTLMLYPKVNMIEYVSSYNERKPLIDENANTELRMLWDESIDYAIINNDYLGPRFEDVIDMFDGLIYHNN
jgi:hypothetical protein